MTNLRSATSPNARLIYRPGRVSRSWIFCKGSYFRVVRQLFRFQRLDVVFQKRKLHELRNSIHVCRSQAVACKHVLAWCATQSFSLSSSSSMAPSTPLVAMVEERSKETSPRPAAVVPVPRIICRMECEVGTYGVSKRDEGWLGSWTLGWHVGNGDGISSGMKTNDQRFL